MKLFEKHQIYFQAHFLKSRDFALNKVCRIPFVKSVKLFKLENYELDFKNAS